MPRGGPRPGAGRKKGSPTKRTRKTTELAAKAAGEGVLPLEVLLAAMRRHYEAGEYDAAAAIAKDAAPYLHPRLGSVVVKGDRTEPVRVVEEIVVIHATANRPPATPSAR